MISENFKKYGKIIFISIFIIANGFIWYAIFYYEARYQKSIIHIFDVGQGDGIFIEAPDGNQILIDGGPDQKILSKLGETMLPWDRNIDLVILTHPHADHIDGLLGVIKRFDVGMIVESEVLHSIPEYAEWHTIIKERGIPLVRAERGQEIHIGGGFQFNVLAPFENFSNKSASNIHDSMVVVKMVYGDISVLFTGDAEKKIEYKILTAGDDIHSDILKIGHHGSKTSTSEDFLQKVSPSFAVISAGVKNRYGHPTQEVIDRLIKFGVRIFRTDQHGDITFVSDGNTFDLQK